MFMEILDLWILGVCIISGIYIGGCVLKTAWLMFFWLIDCFKTGIEHERRMKQYAANKSIRCQHYKVPS